MSKAEDHITQNTKTLEEYGKEYFKWLTPDQARRAVEIAREELIDKAIGWIEEINNHHHIMRYSDSCEPPISELTEWFKNYMKEGSEDE
jgi:hypothetical protein